MAMDFLVVLLAHQDQTVIFVVIDRFSKASQLETLPTYFIACKAAELFTQMICKLQGYPKSTNSDL